MNEWGFGLNLSKLQLTRRRIILSFPFTHPERASDPNGQQNMRGLVASTELEMETAEADDMVRRRHFFPLTRSKTENVSLKSEVEFILSNVLFDPPNKCLSQCCFVNKNSLF